MVSSLNVERLSKIIILKWFLYLVMYSPLIIWLEASLWLGLLGMEAGLC